VFGQHRQLAEDDRKLAIIAMLELEQDGQRVFHHDTGHVCIVIAVQRCALLDEGLETELHVLGLHRMTVVKTCFGTQVKTYPGVIRGLFDARGDQPVGGHRLVHALHGKCVVDQFQALGCHTFVDERVEAVETAETGLTKYPTLGRVGVHVVEVLKIVRVFGRFIVQGHCPLACSQGAAGGQAEHENCAGLRQQGSHGHHVISPKTSATTRSGPGCRAAS
jgi:hypothetical protein